MARGDQAIGSGNRTRQNCPALVVRAEQVSVVAIRPRVGGRGAGEIELLHLAECVVAEVCGAAVVVGDGLEAAVSEVRILTTARGRGLREDRANLVVGDVASGLTIRGVRDPADPIAI